MSVRPRRSRESAGRQQEVSKPVSEAPIDATTLRVRQLREILANQAQNKVLLHDLDFVDLDDDTFRALFIPPNPDVRKYHLGEDGTVMLPPKARRRSHAQIKEFFKSGPGQKNIQIQKYENYRIDRSGFVNYTQSTYCVSLQEPAIPPSAAAPTAAPAASPTASTAASPAASTNPDSPSPTPTKCGGISIQYLKRPQWRYSEERFEEKALGFADTYRESLMTRVRFENPRNPFGEWNFGPHVLGALSSGRDKYRMVWTCQEITDGSSEPFLMNNAIDFGRYTFKHVECGKVEGTLSQGLCKACLNAKPLLLRRFDNNVNLHTAEFNPKRNKQFESTPSLMDERAVWYAQKLKRVSRRLSYKTRALEKLTEDTGVECPINEDSDKIFDISMEENVKQFLSSDPNDRTAAIAQYVFTEACMKHEQAKLHGRKSLRHSPLVIRLAASVYSKMGHAGGGYDLLARCFNLPTSRTIRNYTDNTASEPDGILHCNLRAAQVCFNERNPDCPDDDHKRAVILKLDEMHVRGRFGVDFHTNNVVGITEDALDKSVIEREFKELMASEKEDGDGEEVTVPEPNKKFLVFVATIADKNQVKQQIVVARYGIRSASAEFIARRLLEIPVALFEYGFIVRHIGCDGATEIRSALHLVGNVSAQEVLGGVFSEEELSGLPMDFIVGYRHPSEGCEEVTILFGGDMPHWVKKFRNAFDNKSRELTYRGRIMRLAALKHIWEATESPDTQLRKTRFTYDYFELDSYKKMRVFLAAGFASNSMIDMIKDYCGEDEEELNKYDGLIELLSAVDRLVDICNAYGAKSTTESKRERDAVPIDCPRHRHVLELLSTLQLFEQWKVECGGYKKTFITWQTHEDLRWLVFGIAGYAALYLKDDCSLAVDQGRFGSDTMEHLFALIRMGNSNPTNQQANEGLSKVGANNAVLDANMFRTKGTNTSHSQVPVESYVADLPTKTQRNKKQKLKK